MENGNPKGNEQEFANEPLFDRLLQKHKPETFLALAGLILVSLGVFFYFESGFDGSSHVEFVGEGVEDETRSKLIVEVAGAVKSPGVYQFEEGARVEDALRLAGGVTDEADSEWLEKVVNRAAKLSDGQKIYIPKIGEVLGKQNEPSSAKNLSADQSLLSGNNTVNPGLININTATLSELDKLPGIGPVYGQSIIDHRPYSSIEDLLTKGALKKSVFEKIKDKVTVF